MYKLFVCKAFFHAVQAFAHLKLHSQVNEYQDYAIEDDGDDDGDDDDNGDGDGDGGDGGENVEITGK